MIALADNTGWPHLGRFISGSVPIRKDTGSPRNWCKNPDLK